MTGDAGIRLADIPVTVSVVDGFPYQDRCCRRWSALSFLFLLCVVAAGVSCCRVVGLVVVVALCLGLLQLLGLCPVSLWLLSLRC